MSQSWVIIGLDEGLLPTLPKKSLRPRGFCEIAANDLEIEYIMYQNINEAKVLLTVNDD